ncbi:MAG: hypothetical protein ABSE62_10735 [Chthoniobacteraceae bacterium]|jgi:hypothetical protein
MAFSRRKTTVAVLRGILGPEEGRERRFARLARRSVSWVKKVSAGQEALSEAAALELERSTGVSAAWLLGGDTKARVVSNGGGAYDFQVFRMFRAGIKDGPMLKTGVELTTEAARLIEGIRAAAGKRGKGASFGYRLTRFLEACEEEFGLDKKAMGAAGKRKRADDKSRPERAVRTARSQGASARAEEESSEGLEVYML